MKILIPKRQASQWDEEIVYSPNKYRETEGTKDDGDICLTTDNEYFIKGSHKDHNIITYEKGLAKPGKMTIPNITKTVLKGFGTGVGGFSNTATILYSMAAIFNKPEQEDQRKEIMTRIKLLREIVGQEIDRIKGADKPSLPSSWKQYEEFSPDDTDEEKAHKVKHNSMVISKKPYFFRYLYPELNQRFKQFENSYNQVSKDMFGIKFKKLLKKENKTDEEKALVRNYQKYSPLITSDCTMNFLCREFEGVDFDIKFNKDLESKSKKKAVSMLPTFEEKYAGVFDQNKYSIVKDLYKAYNARKQMKHLAALLDTTEGYVDVEDFSEIRSSVYMMIIQDLQNVLLENNISGEEVLFYLSRIAPAYSNFNWSFAWDLLEDQIIELIPQGKSYYPVRDEEHGRFYLGGYYSLRELEPDRTEEALELLDKLTAEDVKIPIDFPEIEELQNQEEVAQ